LFARFAETLLSQGDIERALTVCLEGCERFPDYPTGFYLLGRCHQAQGDFEDARAALDTSLRLDAENPRGFELLAQIYADLGIPTLALKCLEEAARLDPFDETIGLQVEQLSAQEPSAPAAIEPMAETTTATAYAMDEVSAAPSEEKAPDRDGVESGVDIATGTQVASGDDDDGHGAERSEPPTLYAEGEAATTQVPEVAETQFEPDPEQHPDPELTAEPESTEPASADEPFGVLQDLPEWEAEALPQPAEPVVEPVPPPVEPDPDASDEVAALGAELFGDELPAAPVEPVKPALPERKVPPTGNANLVSTDRVEDVETGSGETNSGKLDNGGANKLRRSIPPTPEPILEPAPVPTVEPAPPADFGGKTTVGVDDYAVSRFSKREDSEMADLLREIDGDEEDERHAEPDLPGPIPTTTLAELYSVQGFVDRAIETYRQLLTANPDNEEAKTRLTALERKD
jgi:tetratricopeptide (TPR) repeat protein